MRVGTDRAYRRGAIVGLTTAELFMLTSFMLVTALLLVEQAAEPQETAREHVPGVAEARERAALELRVEKLTAESEHLENQLTQEKETLRSERERYQRTLAQEKRKRRQAEKDADEVRKALEESESQEESHEEAKAAVAAAIEENEGLQAALKKAVEEKQAVEDALRKAETALHDLHEEHTESGQTQAEERAVVQGYITQLKETIASLTEEVIRAQAAKEAAREELDRERQEQGTTQTVADKGVDPPCWYERVAKKDGGTREKALYALDVAIHDKYIVLGRRDPPKGGPDQGETGSYAEEYKRLGLQSLPYRHSLNNAQVRKALAPLREAGNQGTVRSYPCKFYAQVWDRTGAASKSRWQEAHANVIQQYVNTYVVQDTPWRH